ncbi:MAG: hypothetical protein NT154_24690 [Verrucomicrobia bacterium]|nr:hypothetical protein [Verrucomicrobiota bacterium]
MTISTKKGLTPEEKTLAFSTAAHESGHFLIASRFNLNPALALLTPTQGYVLHQPGDPAVTETLCFAGFMAEDILGCRNPSRKLPKTLLTETTLDAYVDEVYHLDRTEGLDWLSASDRAAISGFGSRPNRPRKAYQILTENLDELKALADYSLKLFEPSMIQARDLAPAVIRAAMTRRATNGDCPMANSAIARLSPLDLAHREADKVARSAVAQARKLSNDIERVSPWTTSEQHRKAADLHHQAATLLFEANSMRLGLGTDETRLAGGILDQRELAAGLAQSCSG